MIFMKSFFSNAPTETSNIHQNDGKLISHDPIQERGETFQFHLNLLLLCVFQLANEEYRNHTI